MDELKELKELKILEMVHTDAAQIEQITQNLNLSHWSKKDYEDELEKKSSINIVGKLNGKVVGFIVARLITFNFPTNNLSVGNHLKINKAGENNSGKVDVDKVDVDIEIYNLAVVEQLQKRGIGQKLLNNLRGVAAEYKSAKIWLEVRESNTKAVNFYRANNFEACYRRKNFYTAPSESAIVMKLEIN